MAYDYTNDQWFGSEYKRALQNGDQAYAQSLAQKMDANPHPLNQNVAAVNAQQVGMINAKTADMGRGNNTFANGGNGLEYNTQGQVRTPGIGAYNTMSGQHGYAVNPGQAMNGLLSVGKYDATPTGTRNMQQPAPTSYRRDSMGMPQGIAPTSYGRGPGMVGQSWNGQVNQPTQTMQNPYGTGTGQSAGYQSPFNQWRGQTPQNNQNTFGGGGYGGTGFSQGYGQGYGQNTQASPNYGGVRYRTGLLGK